MELIVTLAAWTVQAGAAALLAALLALAASLIPLVRRVKWRKRWAAAGGAVILMLALLCGHPLLRYHKGVEPLPPDLQAAVMRYSRGLYSGSRLGPGGETATWVHSLLDHSIFLLGYGVHGAGGGGMAQRHKAVGIKKRFPTSFTSFPHTNRGEVIFYG